MTPRERDIIEPPDAAAKYQVLLERHGDPLRALAEGLRLHIDAVMGVPFDSGPENQDHHAECLAGAKVAAMSLPSAPESSFIEILRCDWADVTATGIIFYIGASLAGMRAAKHPAEREISNQLSSIVVSDVPSPFRDRVRRRLARGGYTPSEAEVGQMWRTALLIFPTTPQPKEIRQLMLANWWPTADEAEQLVREARPVALKSPVAQAILDQAFLQLAARAAPDRFATPVAHGL